LITKESIKIYFNDLAQDRLKWKKKNAFYHKSIEEYYSFLIPENSKVLEIGCGIGDLLNKVKPSYGVGIDFSSELLEVARLKYPHLLFKEQDAEDLHLEDTFDYIILSDLVTSLWDVQKVIYELKKVSNNRTRIIISTHNYLWEPILKFTEFLGLKKKQPLQNWLSVGDIKNLLHIEGLETIKDEQKLLLPIKIPFLNFILNKFIANLPIVNHLCLVSFIVARPRVETKNEYTVSVLIPARNERGNIENAIKRLPIFGKSQEVIFVEGNSSDGTFEEMLRIKEKYSDKNIIVMKQTGKGKGNAVREGFDKASGDVLMILDADLTMPPEDLPKYYEALVNNKGEFINGCRLVYPMEGEAMRFLNLIANKFFGLFFTYILGQRLKDTLCGTKVLLREDYVKIIQNRKYFGDFDPFGDFDLLFGAAKLNLKIVEVPIRYKDRQYGSTQISRFAHGWLLIQMSLFAARKIKFR
jgi:ubiquinone/menaquinone biosynthesis C-methylase UbiE